MGRAALAHDGAGDVGTAHRPTAGVAQHVDNHSLNGRGDPPHLNLVLTQVQLLLF